MMFFKNLIKVSKFTYFSSYFWNPDNLNKNYD